MKLSIAIPTYECKGMGWLYLAELLNSIIKQSDHDVEVIVSDQSTDDKVKKLCDLYVDYLNLKYVSGHHLPRKNSPNANNAINNCSGEYIKLMFGDDFFVSETAIEEIKQACSRNPNWIVSASWHCHNIHYMETGIMPRYNPNILMGINTISSPSILTIKGKHLFDENLELLMDCEFYYRLYQSYGEPYFIRNLLICNRLHSMQIGILAQDKLESEKEYCIKKHLIKE